MGERERPVRASVDALPTRCRAADSAGSLKGFQYLPQALVLDGKRVAQLRSREYRVLGKKREQVLLETASVLVAQLSDDFEMGRFHIARDQFENHRWRSRRCAVLVREHQAFLGSPQVEVRVAEGMEVTGAAQSLTGGDSRRGVFSAVMHQHDGEVELALKGAEVGQEPGHFAGVVLIDCVESHQGIEQKQPGPEPLGRLEQTRAMRLAIEPQSRGGDDVHLDAVEMETAMASHPRDALAHDRQRIPGAPG